MRFRPRERSLKRSDSGQELVSGRQRNLVDESLRRRDCAVVERGDAASERVDKAVEFDVWKGPIYVSVSLRRQTACEMAGVSGRLFHDLCRTFARDADNHGVSRSVAKEVMGRKTEAICARYRIVAEDEKVAALLNMQRKPIAKLEPTIAMASAAVQ